jgi:hypothetical protein
MMEVEYRTSVFHWRCGDDRVTLLARGDRELLSLPIEFLERADLKTARYLLFCASQIAEIPEDSELFDTNGNRVKGDVQVGKYHILDEEVRFKRGPISKSLSLRLLKATEDSETMSRSSRSSKNQSFMKQRLLQRDGRCLVTDEDDISLLVCCHIVPFNLGLTYLNSIERGYTMLYDERDGLLLSPNIHKSYDNYELGFYFNPERGRFQVHVFGRSGREYHGQFLRPVDPHFEYIAPSKKLLAWHYQQCLMKMARGFGVD